MNTNTLIKKGKELADLQNSNCFTNGELFTMLNDAYTTTYNESIDCGENYFVKKAGKTIPKDCYKIKKVGDYLRLNEDYKIENNRIIGNVSKIEYWPMPDTLFFEAEPQTKDLDPTFTNGKYIEDGYLKNMDGQSIPVMEADTYYIGENHCFAVSNDQLYDAITNTLLPNHTLFTLPNDIIPYNYEEKLIGYVDLEIATYNPATDGLYNAIDSKFETVATITDKHLQVYSADYTASYDLPIAPTVIRFINDSCILCSNSHSILILNIYSGKIWCKNCETIGIPYINLDSMYGVVGVDVFGNTQLISPFVNMELDYPNNFFWDILIYRIARSMRLKLQQDTLHIDELLATAERNYYDSLRKSNSGYGRLRDVYGSNRWRLF